MAPFDRSLTSLLAFHSNYGAILYRSRDIASYEIFIPRLYLGPSQGVTPPEFRNGDWYL